MSMQDGSAAVAFEPAAIDEVSAQEFAR